MFWCGDFNYRIDLTYEEVFYFVKRQDWKKLLEFDQLQLQKSSGKVSRAFKTVFNICPDRESHLLNVPASLHQFSFLSGPNSFARDRTRVAQDGRVSVHTQVLSLLGLGSVVGGG